MDNSDDQRFGYSFDQYDTDMVASYANLPPQVPQAASAAASTANSAAAAYLRRPSIPNLVTNSADPPHPHTAYPVHHHQPTPNSLNSQHSLDFVALFSDLAQSVNVHLSDELTGHLITLIRLGVPPDDIYLFLSECFKSAPRV